jgi:hypothetical protein
MKKLLLILMGLVLGTSAYAQNSARISGQVWDNAKQELGFVNVFLLKATDSSMVKAALADEAGKFLFEDLAYGEYLVSASMVGYEKVTSPKVLLTAENAEVSLGYLQLNPTTNVLKDVTVTARKPLLEQQADKLVMNVEASIISAGSTALELLQRAPGVSIDQNDNISLKGKQGVQIYMDGKPTYMSQEQLANLLKNMNSDQIEKIEIITNPSSRYDAAGNSGIINLVMKKNKNFGTNGSVTLGGGISLPPAFAEVDGLFPKYNANLNLNNRQGKFNTFGNLSYRAGNNYNSNEFYRVMEDKTFDQFSQRFTQSSNFTLRAGSDYFLSKNTTIGVLLNTSFGSWGPKEPVLNSTVIRDNEQLSSSLLTTSNQEMAWKNYTANVNFKQVLNSKGAELTADVDYSIYDNNSKEKGMLTEFFGPDGKPVGDKLLVTSNMPNKFNIIAAKTDFTLPFPSTNARLEAGLKTSFVTSDNNMRFFNDGTLDLGRSNHFIYTENINAAYSTYNRKFNDKWSLQAGLRLEHTRSQGESKTLKETKDRNYLNLFPSLYITRVLDKNNTLNFNYSRRIDRPEYRSLNPFIFFLDPYTYELGNEYLRPQLTHAVELSHTLKQSIITTFGYSYTSDFTNQVVKNAKNEPEILAKLIEHNPNAQIDPNNVSFALRENIGNRQTYTAGVSFPVKVNKWWNMNNNVNANYSIYKGELMGSVLDVSNLAYSFFTSQNFIVGKGWNAEASMWYNSKDIEGTFSGREIYAVNAGVSKSLLKGKGTFRLNVNDIFATARWRGETNFGGVNMKISNVWDSRGVRATFVYRFGNQNVKSARNRQTATASEQQRVGSQN